jgi:nitrate/nitrite transport system permease protein
MPGTTEADVSSGAVTESVPTDSIEVLASADAAVAPDSALTVSDDSPSLIDRVLQPVREFFTPAGLKGAAMAAWPPVLGIVAFLAVWAGLAPLVNTQLGTLPGPVEVAEAGQGLWDQYRAVEAEKAAFYEAQDARNVELVASGQPTQNFEFAGSPTIVSQIWTSLRTVALGFLIGTVVAVPIGLLAGLSSTFQRAINPLVQLFKPVSPLAWLPIVQLVIAAAMTSNDPILPISFVVSALVVTLCSLWPTLINTTVGASSVDKDLLNVAQVLRLGPITKLRKIILPTAIPYIFTGMRLSLGVGWMVLIAAEMLAQNPGLGKFVWDEFQNGSSQSLSRIMFAVIVIGVIGVVLDQIMARLESFMSRNRVS